MMNSAKMTIIILMLLCICGCSVYRDPIPAADYYYLNPKIDMTSIGRVALIQLKNHSAYPQISTDVTRAVFEEIQKKQLFSVRVISEDNPAWQSLDLDMESKLEPQQLFLAAKKLNCDAIITGDITEYTPYPHMVLGLRMQMISCINGELVWAFEQVWDTADKKTEYRIKKYLTNKTRTGTETLGEQLVTVSSIKFIKFIAYEVAMTF